MIMIEPDASVQRVLRAITRRIGLEDRQRIYEAAALFAVRNRTAFEQFANEVFRKTPIESREPRLSPTEQRLLAAACAPDARVWQSRIAIRQGAKTAWLCPPGAGAPRRVKIAVLEALVERGLLTLDPDPDADDETDLVWRKS